MSPNPPHDLPFDRPEAFLEGQAMVINKPLTWTSFDVVNKIRYALRLSLIHISEPTRPY